MAFVVDRKVRAIDVVSVAKTADRNAITEVRVFDLYEGENLPADKNQLPSQ